MIKRNSKKYCFFAAVFVAAAFLSAYLVHFLQTTGENSETVISKVCLKENCFEVEVADSSEEREKGLMFRANLKKDSGMLFVFEKEGVYSFWMKNTLIPLDIIWIDEKNEIVYIQKNAQPCKVDICKPFGPGKSAKYVLEINGGFSDKMEIKAGDEIVFR